MATLSVIKIIGMCLAAWAIGYSGGALQRVLRRSFEVLE